MVMRGDFGRAVWCGLGGVGDCEARGVCRLVASCIVFRMLLRMLLDMFSDISASSIGN